MTLDELHKILSRGEGISVEFKSSFNIETIESLVAFANAKGGAAYVGIKDNGEIIGIQLGEK